MSSLSSISLSTITISFLSSYSQCFITIQIKALVEVRRIELLTPCLQSRCSPSWAIPPLRVVGLGRLELPTSRLSGVRSNHLSYKPLSLQLNGLSPVSSIFKRIRRQRIFVFLSLKGGDPAAGSPTATLLRLRPSRWPYRGRQAPLRVTSTPSGRTNSHGVTGGVYKTRERIHRGMLIRDY